MQELHVYARTIERAEKDLGHLGWGQRADLLLDNHPEMRDSGEAHQVLLRLDGDRILELLAQINEHRFALGYETLLPSEALDSYLELVGQRAEYGVDPWGQGGWPL